MRSTVFSALICGEQETGVESEFAIMHDRSVLPSNFSARLRSSSDSTASVGFRVIDVNFHRPSIFATIPSATTLKEENWKCEALAIASKVATKHEATPDNKKCSGVQVPGIPPNSGGAENLTSCGITSRA